MSPDDGGSCGETQTGCQVGCEDHDGSDGSTDAWCVISNPGCKEEEDGDGWAFCVIPTPTPTEYNGPSVATVVNVSNPRTWDAAQYLGWELACGSTPSIISGGVPYADSVVIGVPTECALRMWSSASFNEPFCGWDGATWVVMHPEMAPLSASLAGREQHRLDAPCVAQGCPNGCPIAVL